MKVVNYHCFNLPNVITVVDTSLAYGTHQVSKHSL